MFYGIEQSTDQRCPRTVVKKLASQSALKRWMAGGGDDNDLHPLVKGLLVTLPKPGTPWSAKNRVDWLSMANFIFRTIYTTDGEDGEVTVKIESGSNKENADQK